MTPAAIHDVHNGADEGTPLCLGCLSPLPAPTHFCRECGMPLTSYATSAPLEQVWAFGWMVNRLLSRRPSRFAVVGAVLISAPALITLVAALVGVPFLFEYARDSGWLADLVGWSPTLIIELLYVVLLVRVVWSYLRPRDPRQPSTSA